MVVILPAVFLAVCFFCSRQCEKREKRLYITLSVAAFVLSFFAAVAAREDHIGASLSGMISVFMR